MKFNSTTDLDGLIQECERICQLGVAGISGSANLLKAFTARINQGLDRFYTLAFNFDTNWNFDDRNQTDLPIATTDLASGQQDYQFASELLAVTQIFIKDTSGTYQEIFEQNDKTEPNTFLTTTSGQPSRYKLIGNSILLDSVPNYNSTAGLKVTFKRNAVKFVSTDTTKEPGIPSLFHQYLPLFASYSFARDNGKINAQAIQIDMRIMEQDLKTFIANRSKPKRFGIRVAQQDNK